MLVPPCLPSGLALITHLINDWDSVQHTVTPDQVEEIERVIDMLKKTCHNAGILITSTMASAVSTSPGIISGAASSNVTAKSFSSNKRRRNNHHGMTESASAAQHVISTPVPEHENSRPNVQESSTNTNIEALTFSSSSIEGVFGEATADPNKQHLIDPDHTESFGNDPIVQGYVDLACRLSFRLPHEPVEDADHLDARELLSPLVEERPLTPRLIHGLIYTLLPGPLRIFEVCSSALDPEPSPEESPVDDFVAIVHQDGEDLPLLVLGVEISKTLYILGSETVDLASWLIGPGWRTEQINPRCLEPHIESTLLSVWIAEACFQSRPLEDVPSSRDLRLRFLVELLAPYQRDSVHEKCGIPTQSETQVQTNEILQEPSEIELERCLRILQCAVQNLKNFEHEALLEALLQKPSKIKLERRLRILQCVDEIGSPHILDSLKLACAKKVEEQPYRAMEQPLFEKLLHMHCNLEMLESQSHLLVARERYIKYCYFETYLRAVKALQEKKHNSAQERRRASDRKRTASFKQGISKELSYTEEIHRPCDNISPSGRKRASDMVKDEICSKVKEKSGGDPTSIRCNINKYISQGSALHRILQGRRSLDPCLLVLFPSFGVHPPSLSMAEFGLELEELEEKALSQPIELKDIDGLTLVEAAWFGEVLQARPELLEQVPQTVFDLISNSRTHDLDIREHDPDSFRDTPLQFFK